MAVTHQQADGDATNSGPVGRANPMYTRGAPASHRILVPSSAAGASKKFFDVWNATGRSITLRALRAIPDASAAVTGALAVALFLQRTSAVGTGGTAMDVDLATLNAMTITKRDPGETVVITGLGGRLAPSGGATAAATLAARQFFPEETNGPKPAVDFLGVGEDIVIPTGTGIMVIQGAEASVGSVAFELLISAYAS